MVSVKEAYDVAKKISTKDHLRQILVFDKGYGFTFTTDQNSVDLGNVCIFVGKDAPIEAAVIPIAFENLDFLQSGKSIPLTMIL